MKSQLQRIALFVVLLLGSSFVFGQTEMNGSVSPGKLLNSKNSPTDSIYKLKNNNKQQDAIFYKSMLENGYSRMYIDSLQHENDPSYVIPFYYNDDFTNQTTSQKSQQYQSVNIQNSITNVKLPFKILTENSLKDVPVQIESIKPHKGSYSGPKITGPEQNCAGAISVCQQTYTQTQSYTGYGYQEVYNTCLLSQEQYSVWYVFTVQVSGTFGFTINTLNDYDFALYNLTTIGGCANVPTSTPVRCNFSGTYGNTGLTASSTSELPALSVPASGSPFMNGLQVTAGNTYALIIDNFTMDANGYTISFTGTSSIFDNSPPTINPPNTIVNNCNGTVTITFSEPVQCSSIASNGSDFTISGGGSITGASGCTAGTLTNQITVSYTAPSSGTYTIGIKVGTDGNTILDKCGTPMLITQTINFNHLGNITVSCNPASGTVCAGNSAILTANGGPGSGATFSWNPAGGTTNPSAAVAPAGTTVYDVTVAYGGCTKNASYTVTVQPPPVVTINPMNPILCSGTTVLTASANPCSGCTYSWTGSWTGSGANTPAVGVGTYNVIATSSAGCVSGSVSSTVSLASAPPANTCNLYYVKPAATGTGDGSTPANAATIQNALSFALCSGATIKMAVGVYDVSNALPVNSNITIEGGYINDATFSVKYSMDGTVGRTTIIRRNNTNPVANNIIAFNVSAGASNFRFQDLRIEMPGSASVAANAAGSRISNYAIYLGSSCSNYNIVRCYIDAGVGANSTSANGAAGANGGNAVAPTLNAGSYAVGSPGTSATSGSSGGWGGWGGYVSNVFYAGNTWADVNCNGTYQAGTDSYYNRTSGWNFVDMNNNNTYEVGTDIPNQSTMGAFTGQNGFGPGGTVTPYCMGVGSVNGGGGGGYTVAGTVAGFAGANGVDGADGTNGANGVITYGGGYYIPQDGANGTNGGSGTGGAGGGGGGYISAGTMGGMGGNGGGGGQGGFGGTGATSGGGAFGVFSVVHGAGNNIVDCFIVASNASNVAGGMGGAKGNGGTGSAGSDGRSINTGLSYTGNKGGYGGYGGTGGRGGNGGNGATDNCQVCDLNGATLTKTVYANFNMNAQPLITETNVSCTAINTNFTSPAAAAWNFGSGASPLTSAVQNPTNVTYSTTGRKIITYNGNTYRDFLGILTTAPSPGNISATYSSGCPSTYYFASSLGSTPGFTFTWSANTVSGNVPTVATPNASSTNITFPNNTAGNLVFTVTLTVSSQCCGTLTPITFNFTAYPYPVAPTVTLSPGTICPGGSSILTATAPANCSFDWYTVASGGAPFASGASCTVSPASTTTYYCEATNSYGCVSTTRTPVIVTVTPTTPPTVPGVSICSPDFATISVSSPIAGATYNFYSGNCVGLLQSSSSSSYTVWVGSTTTYYVSVQLPGCNASACTSVTVTITGSPASVTWNGTTGGLNNWFINTNWTPNCLPTCNSDVLIPSGMPSNPDIGFSVTYGNAETKNITLNNGATLSFSDPKAELDVCGNFTHSGTITTNSYGKIRFKGSTAQSYARTSTGSGELYNVIIVNTATPPTISIKTGTGYQDMVIANNGSFSLQTGIVVSEGARKLVVKNTAPSAISGQNVNSYICGRLTRYVVSGSSYDFPVGGNPSGATVYPYQLMNIDLSSISGGLTNLTVLFENLASNANSTTSPGLPLNAGAEGIFTPLLNNGGPNLNVGIVNNGGVWTVIPDAGTATYNLALYGRNFDNAGAGPSWSILKRTTYSICGAGNQWALDGSHLLCNNTAGVLTARRTGLSGFSQFAIAKTTIALPVELITFDITCINKTAQLSWATASEINNNYFTIERSCGTSDEFVFITTIPGAGNSNTIKRYSFIDNDFPGGICYYRLSQTDFNGTKRSFDLASANCGQNTGFNLVSIFPNPVKDEMTVLFTTDNCEPVFLHVTDVIGQKLYEKNMIPEIGLNKVGVDVSSFSNGVYFVKLFDVNKLFIKKIVKNNR